MCAKDFSDRSGRVLAGQFERSPQAWRGSVVVSQNQMMGSCVGEPNKANRISNISGVRIRRFVLAAEARSLALHRAAQNDDVRYQAR
jgi:hypothetical protein